MPTKSLISNEPYCLICGTPLHLHRHHIFPGSNIRHKRRVYQFVREILAMKYLKVWTDLYKAIKPFSDTEKGRLFTAMLIYAEQGIEPEFRGNERFIWPTIKAEIGRQRDAYEHQCEVNRVNVTNRYEPLRVVTNGNESKQEKTKEKTKEKTEDKEREKKNFTPPTLAEVAAYCKERRNNINPNRFVAWYNAYGWQRNGQPVEDWKALIQTWEDDVPYQDGEPKKSKYANVKIN